MQAATVLVIYDNSSAATYTFFSGTQSHDDSNINHDGYVPVELSHGIKRLLSLQ
jgi:hypothetical protein